MKLEQLLPSSQVLVVKDIDGNDTDFKIHLVGKDSKQFREASNKVTKSMIGKGSDDQEVLMKANGELLAACIIGWEGLADIPYTPEKALEFMSMPEMQPVQEQVDAFVAQRANFFRKSGGQAGKVGSPNSKA